jgi:D-beta-D-heptose 7-phosphate kinase/D-beta-D-heptose 1-phosphate adenosyltransferase
MRNSRRRVISGKIKTILALQKICAGLRKRGKRIVFTNGCFDLLHLGHVKYLQQAAGFGDVLVVAVNSDASVRRLKGPTRPIVRQLDRIRVLAALESVDYAVFFNAPTPLEVIKRLRPAVLVKGADWNRGNIVGADFVQSYGGRVSTIRLLPGRSTTQLIKRIAKAKD